MSADEPERNVRDPLPAHRPAPEADQDRLSLGGRVPSRRAGLDNMGRRVEVSSKETSGHRPALRRVPQFPAPKRPWMGRSSP